MIREENIDYIRYLYRKIFGEDEDNSKELITFVQNQNPHPLRIKIEEEGKKITNDILDSSNNTTIEFNQKFDRATLIKELDTIIMNYIENNYV